MNRVFGDQGNIEEEAPLNPRQSTHTASVHKSVSESAARLAKRYPQQLIGNGFSDMIEAIHAWGDYLDEGDKERAAKTAILRLTDPEYLYVDPASNLSTKQLLALCWKGIFDESYRCGDSPDAFVKLRDALYEAQREYAFDETGNDTGCTDKPACAAGSFNKIMEKMVSILPDAEVIFITKASALAKFPHVVEEEAMRYLRTLNSSLALDECEKILKGNGLMTADFWEKIKKSVRQRIHEEFLSVFNNATEELLKKLGEN
jgi:hypothetical protein